MRQRFLLVTLPVIGLVLSFAGDAAASCVTCGYTGHHSVYYEQPVLVVRRPPVVLKLLEVTEYIPCGDGAVVNQGQYRTEAALIPQPRCFRDDVPVHYRN